MKLQIFKADQSCTLIGYLDTEQTLLGCNEAQSYLIQVPDKTAKLYADDALLERDDSGEHWVWQPGFFAGELAFDLELPGTAFPLRYIVDVGPAKDKTGRAQFIEYLKQITAYAPRLVTGTEPAMQGLAGSSSFMFLWLRYARLRQFVDRYLYGLQAICERPYLRLSSRREQIPLPMVKRVDVTTVQRLVSNPRLLSALAGEATPGATAAAQQNDLDVPFHEPTLDNPANRLMTLQLGEVRRLTRSLLAEIKDLKVGLSETETDLMARLPRRIRFLQYLDKQLGRVARRDPFASANITKRGAAEFNAVSGNPHYSMTHQVGIRILRLGLAEAASDEKHYIAPTWAIYEAWCFVVFAEALEARHLEFTWQLSNNPVSADLILRGKNGEKQIALFYQMTCPSLETSNKYGYFSISRERRPDLVLEVSNGKQKHFVCLDSKYTASRGRILDSMASAHIYHDSIKCGTVSPALSIILVPDNKGLSALGSNDYWNKYGVGCATLSKKGDASTILDQLYTSLH